MWDRFSELSTVSRWCFTTYAECPFAVFQVGISHFGFASQPRPPKPEIRPTTRVT